MSVGAFHCIFARLYITFKCVMNFITGWTLAHNGVFVLYLLKCIDLGVIEQFEQHRPYFFGLRSLIPLQ